MLNLKYIIREKLKHDFIVSFPNTSASWLHQSRASYIFLLMIFCNMLNLYPLTRNPECLFFFFPETEWNGNIQTNHKTSLLSLLIHHIYVKNKIIKKITPQILMNTLTYKTLLPRKVMKCEKFSICIHW